MKKLFILCLLAFALALSAQAQLPKTMWAAYGLVVNNTPGNTAQQNPKVLGDEKGGYFILWEDGRRGYYDIYAQKLDEAGRSLWGKEGIAACLAPDNQTFPQMTGDGAGGIIIVWQDHRSGNTDIFAQRISSAGTVLWGESGLPVCTTAEGQVAPEITSDGAGGAIITWHDYRSASGEDIYAQRIDNNGRPVWQSNGVPVSTATGTQWYPKIASDGTGGAIVVWTDGRAGSSDNNIYAQRLDYAGKSLWAKDGIPVCSAPNNQERPVTLQTANGAFLAWNDSRSGNIDIYTQRINLDGSLLWQKDGVPVCVYPDAQQDPRLAEDGYGGLIVVWADRREEEGDIYVQRISPEGKISLPECGRPVCVAEGNQSNPALARFKDNNLLVVWEDERRGKSDLFAQKINSAGIPLWEDNGIPLASNPQQQLLPNIIPTQSGNMLVVWEDFRFGNSDIFAQKLSPEGKLLFDKNGIVVCNAPGAAVKQNVEMALTDQGEIILVFEDARGGFFNIYAQKVSREGRLAWGQNGIVVAKAAANQSNPRIIADGAGGAIVAWEDYRDENFPAIRVQHLSRDGRKLWSTSALVTKLKSRQINPMMISDKAGGAIITWQDDRDALGLQDIYAQRISASGALLWGKKGKAVISANGNQMDAAMIGDGAGGAFLAWTDYRNGDRNPDIYAQRINSSGDPLWKEDGVLVCGAPDIQRNPKIISDDESGIIVSWTDKGGGSYDIYAQRLGKDGQTVWTTDGIPINQLSRTQQNAKFGNKNILVWEDYRYGNWDIFAGAVSASGKNLWGDSGMPVAVIPHTQYAPQIISWGERGVIIAWEDYRSGKQYELYIQKLSAEGKSIWPENGIKIETHDGARTPKIIADFSENSFYIFWEDYTEGERAIYGQKFLVE